MVFWNHDLRCWRSVDKRGQVTPIEVDRDGKKVVAQADETLDVPRRDEDQNL